MNPTHSAPGGPTRRDVLRAAVIGGAAVALPVGLAGPAAASTTAAVTALGFHIGGDGKLHAAGSTSTAPVAQTVVGPPGGSVSAVRRSDGTTAVFLIGSHGGLVAGFTSAAGSGMTFVRHPQGGLAAPGGRIAAVEGATGTHVHFTGTNGAIYHAMYSRSGTVTIPPAYVVAPGSVAPTTPLAAFRVADRFGVAHVAATGAIRTSAAVIGSGAAGPIAVWTTTTATPTGAARPNTPVAATSGTSGVSVFYATTTGTLSRIPLSHTTPLPPVALSSAGAVPVGAHLSATTAPTGEQIVAYADAAGAIRASSDAYGPSPDPWTISPAGIHRSGGPLSVTYGGDDNLLTGWCGNDRWLWLNWRWLRRPRPGPVPDPWFELTNFRTVLPVQDGFAVSVTMPGFA